VKLMKGKYMGNSFRAFGCVGLRGFEPPTFGPPVL